MSSSMSITRLRERRQTADVRRQQIVDASQAERRTHLTEDEDRQFRDLTDEIREYDDRISELENEEKRTAQAAGAARRAGRGGSGAGETIYGPESRHSYIADFVAVSRGAADVDARDRLNTYAQEQRDLNRSDGAGGHFVPPTWLMQDFVGLPRPGRVTADLLTRRPLPPGTDTINIPRFVTGTATAIQPADNDPVQEVDISDSVITAPVRTIAGQQDIAQQLLDQSPINFDELVMADLLADFQHKLSLQVLSGTGAAGQILGLRNVGGAAVTFTSASPTLAELYKRVADSVGRISTGLFQPPNAISMHPRRWSWALAQSDTTGRPLIVPNANGPTNAAGIYDAPAAQGQVGTLAGIPVYLDPSIPTNLGAGTNEDLILVLNTANTILYESSIRMRVMPETLSGTLSVRCQLFGYIAQATRNAQSVAVISGTGLSTPSFV